MSQIFSTKESLRRKIRDFLPEKSFDVHTHIYDAAFMRSYADKPNHMFGWAHVTAKEYLDGIAGETLGFRPESALLIPAPDPLMGDRSNGLRDMANVFVSKQLEENPGLYGEVFVLPGDSEADIEGMLTNERIRGLKCYYYASPNGNQGPANEFLPESAWQAAHRRGLAITLHLACNGAMSDPRNMEYLETMLGRYPNARLILAHAGRAFAVWTCLEPMKRLSRFENVYYDLSAICEPAPMAASIKAAGIDRVMWGSDYPCCDFVGRAVSLADGFVWYDEAAARACGYQGEVFTVFEENLIALYTAADLLDLDRSAVEKLFYSNAERVIAKGGR